MNKVVIITPMDESNMARKPIVERYPDAYLDQRSFKWRLYLPDEYQWTKEDADFMNDLADNKDLLASWAYIEKEGKSE